MLVVDGGPTLIQHRLNLSYLRGYTVVRSQKAVSVQVAVMAFWLGKQYLCRTTVD